VTKGHVAHRRCFDCCACMWPMCKPFRHTTEYILSGGASAVSPSHHHILCLFPLNLTAFILWKKLLRKYYQNGITKYLTNGVRHFVITPILNISQHLFDKLDTSSSCQIKQLQPCISFAPKPGQASKPHPWSRPTRTLEGHKGSR
jgi:hypothetical protein